MTFLSSYQALETEIAVTFGNGEKGKAAGYGEVGLRNTKTGEVVVLTHVLYVPGAFANLFSVRRADAGKRRSSGTGATDT